MQSGVAIARSVVGLFLFSGAVAAQSQPMPGAPSIPFAPVAQSQNGGAGPQVTYQYGIEFVTVGAPGNPSIPAPIRWPNDPSEWPALSPGFSYQRGSVSEPFRMSRYEVTASQWCAFYSAVAHVNQQGAPLPFVQFPSGAFGSSVVGGPGGSLQPLPGREMNAVGGISWRTAAMYCNWLHNDQAVTRDAFMSGAYDVSTFGYNGINGDVFTDQLTHSPGARFWIPTLNEWLKAGHYDPNRFGTNQGGYWAFPTSSDAQPLPGAPGTGQSNYGYEVGTTWQYFVPLGSYPGSQSPWGLLDMSGATSEWLEETTFRPDGTPQGEPVGRYLEGSHWYQHVGLSSDYLSRHIGEGPSFPDLDYGLRIAALAPEPGMGGVIILGISSAMLRRQRRIGAPPCQPNCSQPLSQVPSFQ